jgi:hypothetical protein
MVLIFFSFNELFVVGKSTMSLVLNEFIYALNDVYRDLSFWPQRGVMLIVMEDLQNWRGFPNV